MMHYGKPEWVMCGVTTGEGVLIIASKKLHAARIDSEQEFVSAFGLRDPINTYEWYTLTAELGEYVIVQGKDYAEAFQQLFEHWNADAETPRPALPGSLVLEEGGSLG